MTQEDKVEEVSTEEVKVTKAKKKPFTIKRSGLDDEKSMLDNPKKDKEALLSAIDKLVNTKGSTQPTVKESSSKDQDTVSKVDALLKSKVASKVLPPTTEKAQSDKFKVKGKFKTSNGTILQPEMAGLRFVLNIANIEGKLEHNPLLTTLDKKWSKARSELKGVYTNKDAQFKFGKIFQTAVQSDVWIINLLCQNKDGSFDSDGVTKCLKEVKKLALYEKANVHVSSLMANVIPDFKAKLESELVDEGVSVTLYL